MDFGAIFKAIFEGLLKIGFKIPYFFLADPPAPLKEHFESPGRFGFGIGLLVGLFLYLFSKVPMIKQTGKYGGIYIAATILRIAFWISSRWLHFQTDASWTDWNIWSDSAFSLFTALLLVLSFAYGVEMGISVRNRTKTPPKP